MVNKCAVLALADFLESKLYEFRMSDSSRVGHGCGTAGCIGGHAAGLWPSVTSSISWRDAELAKKLGISKSEHDKLCYLKNDLKSAEQTIGRYSNVTREMAVDTLRRLARTGKVTWRFPKDKLSITS